MVAQTHLLDVLIAINAVSSDSGIDFEAKLDRILSKIVNYLQARSGSIMMLTAGNHLEVAAATAKPLVGVQQTLDEKSPSAWVVKNRRSLYVGDDPDEEAFQSRQDQPRFDHYRSRSFFLAPIMNRDDVVGVINVTDKIGEDRFSNQDRQALLDIAGQVIGALENQRLTEHLVAERKALEEKNAQLHEVQKLKTDLYDMLVHDLKTPIAEIMANLDILSYTTGEEDREPVDLAKMGCDNLYGMVVNLLDIARMEEGRLQLVPEPIDAVDLIKEVMARLFGLGQIKGIIFQQQCPPEPTVPRFRADRGMLIRVLQNLLTNAVNHSPPNETVQLGCEAAAAGRVKFYVRDNGPGVAPMHQQAIFDKYFQLRQKKEGRIYSTGLGLTFCYMAIKAHGGQIGVDSDGRNGSCFYFVLPPEPGADSD